MVGKSQIKYIRSLQQKKHRKASGLFVAEGVKLVNELLLSGYSPRFLYTTDPEILPENVPPFEVVKEADLIRMSGLRSPNKVLAVFPIPESSPFIGEGWILALDSVQDPGNLGTIIRLCDWFGIPNLVCSEDTVDCYNPKVLQATMGSIARVNLFYTPLSEFLSNSKKPVYGAFMNGESAYGVRWPDSGVLVMGNEAHGISGEVGDHIHKKVSIPQFGRVSAESLNVATATAILLSELRRNPGN
ncbi:RNA methyltransferase, TrmH family [Muriicola jejuensis]|uniref:RNA methyltransferase n=1 Tax=Muriicola jejuensis TaxID=504488 RepID=A0A6P0U8A8_9FLAO|nr:RNA methyltransferase [Muriicola jejuensis]NER09314.1 RNA methyltransferase [Muriicola jejuensis]SMP09554.1 RNA methyltransferase, TrmH family [Muriicola jejuensis]